MKKLIGILALAYIIFGLNSHAWALTQFKKPFAAKYAANHKDENLPPWSRKPAAMLATSPKPTRKFAMTTAN